MSGFLESLSPEQNVLVRNVLMFVFIPVWLLLVKRMADFINSRIPEGRLKRILNRRSAWDDNPPTGPASGG